jgi:hypothetical protein
LSDIEAENSLLRRRFATYEADRDKDKKLIQQLKEQLQAVRAVSARALDVSVLEIIWFS